ncbi:MAG TPA: sodium:solute symporter family protein [Vicinamibacterales bacterium]|nr:sodium:solute symporter family protein [Vicinamibacterales bacterium]
MDIATLDWVVIILYLITITAIGLIVGYRVRYSGDFFLGGRRFGPWLMMGQSFGVGTHAEMPVALAGAVYGVGASAIWFQWKNLFITPFYWIMAPVFRRVRRTTMAEFTEDRYGSWMAGLYIVFALCYFVINMGSMLKGAGKVISQATGGGLEVNEIVVAMTVMFMLYSFVGGLVAAAWTDLFQGLLILTLSFLLIPLGWGVVGGLDGMQASLQPFYFSLATPSGIGPWAIAMLTINGLVGIMAQPHQLAAVGTGRDERTCRIGMFFGNFIKRVCTVGWALVGLIVAAMIAQGHAEAAVMNDPENAFGFACRYLLFPGALGLMVAAILAANMSTCSAFLVDSGALFTEGLYRQRLAPGRADRHYLWVGRFSGFLITMLGVLYSLFLIESVLYTFLLTETLATYVGISVLGGILWPRANRWGALASLLSSLATNFLLYYLTGQRLDHWDPNVFLAALAVGSVALVVVSLLTEPEPRDKMAAFFDRLQTSSDGDSAVVHGRAAAAAETPAASRGTTQPLLLVNLLRPARAAAGRGWRVYRDDLGGFALGWVLVIVLVAATALMLRM